MKFTFSELVKFVKISIARQTQKIPFGIFLETFPTTQRKSEKIYPGETSKYHIFENCGRQRCATFRDIQERCNLGTTTSRNKTNQERQSRNEINYEQRHLRTKRTRHNVIQERRHLGTKPYRNDFQNTLTYKNLTIPRDAW